MSSTNIADLRQKIDSIDDSIMALLSARFEVTREVGALKARENLPAQSSDREEQQFNRLTELASELNIPLNLVLLIYRNIIDTVVHEHRQSKFN